MIVAVFALFPEFSATAAQRGRSNAATALADSTTLVLEAGGMTCAACERPVEQALGTLAGVRGVHADAVSGHVTLALSRGAGPSDSLVVSKLRSAGYELRPR